MAYTYTYTYTYKVFSAGMNVSIQLNHNKQGLKQERNNPLYKDFTIGGKSVHFIMNG